MHPKSELSTCLEPKPSHRNHVVYGPTYTTKIDSLLELCDGLSRLGPVAWSTCQAKLHPSRILDDDTQPLRQGA